MPSLISAAFLLPAGTLALLLPPLLQLSASEHSFRPSAVWPPFRAVSEYVLGSFHPCRLTLLLDCVVAERHRRTIVHYDDAFPGLFAACGLALIGYPLASFAIAGTKDVFKKRGFRGKDLLKEADKDEVAETLGLPTAAVYVALLFLFIPFRYFSSSLQGVKQEEQEGWEARMDGRGGFPHHELASFLSALLSFLSAIVLGFVDDVFDIRWRYKLPIPVLSSIPLLMVYYAGGGGTIVVVPGWPGALRRWFGAIVDLGPLYYVYMSLLSTFCTNSINILAGINGVEVGQALVIAVSLCLNDALYLDARAGMPGSRSSKELLTRHLLSLYLLLPLVGVCLALFSWNRYPAKVFVGDTFCYFAGMVFSTVGILGHFSKTVLLFFAPQIVNFGLSCPQLFGLVPNPRHRVPRFDSVTGALYPSVQYFASGDDETDKALPNTSSKPLRRASTVATIILKLLSTMRLVQLEHYDDASIKSTTNLTILNAILVARGVRHTRARRGGEKPFTGPHISEHALWVHTMLLQVAGSCLAFAIRYWLASVVFP